VKISQLCTVARTLLHDIRGKHNYFHREFSACVV